MLIDGASSKTVEAGTTTTGAVLSWTLSGNTPQSQSISNGVGVVPVGTLTKTVIGTFTTTQTWTLTVSATGPTGTVVTASSSVSLNVRQKRYWGVSTLTSLNSAGILGLGGSEFATNRSKSVTYNATGGRYVYYAYPTSFGVIAGVTVNGLAFSDYTTSTVSFTNASGHVENYYVVRFNSLQNGSSIPVVWS